MPPKDFDTQARGETTRRRSVLESALETFSRFGYRKTSMDDVAKAAHISRPGLYFLFESKPALFREAIEHALDRDIGLIAQQLHDSDLPLAERVIAAFDLWAGSYIGPLTGEVAALSDADPAVFGSILDAAPRQFEERVAGAISRTHPADGAARTRTLISASIGIKHQVRSRADYVERLEVAVGLLLN
jgi:AcrR family transcriptional regulator